MPKVVHIKDLNKFPFVDRFHVKVINLTNKSDLTTIITTKNIDLATTTAKKKGADIHNIFNGCSTTAQRRVIVTRESIIQMY